MPLLLQSTTYRTVQPVLGLHHPVLLHGAALVTFQAHQPVHPLVFTHHERFLIRSRLLLHHKVCHSTPLIVHLAGQDPLVLDRPACPPGLAGQAPTRGHGEISYAAAGRASMVLDLAPQISHGKVPTLLWVVRCFLKCPTLANL